MKIRKTFVALALVVMLINATTAFAAVTPPGNTIQPYWTNTSDVDVFLSINGTTASCSAVVEGYSGTTKITAEVVLQVKNGNGTYTTVKTWANLSVSGTRLLFSDTCNVISGYTYRLTITAKVTRNNTTETVSNWVEK